MSLELSGTTGVKGVAGSVSAPSIVGDDTNTGISFPSADTIKFSTGGVERMAITNSGVSGITAGITMADQWRVSSAFSSQNELISFNWERNDTDFAQIGTGMSYNSGIFSFPQTGIYWINFDTSMFKDSTSVRYAGARIKTTINNSSYNTRADGYTNIHNSGSNTYAFLRINCIFDVTDVSTHKVSFHSDAATTISYDGSSTSNRTSATFIRLGDT